jgi:colanic acid biosynthesis glycosyl transferase WcaI
MFLSGLTMPCRYDVVMAVSPPLTLGLSGYLLSVLKGRSFVYNIQDVWPDSLISSGLIKAGVVAGLLRVLERLVYNRATRLTALCDEIKADLVRKKVPADKIVVIPNYADCEGIQPLSRQNPFRASLGLHDEFVVMYAGTLAYRYGLEVLLEAAGAFLDRQDVRFVIVGHGPAKEELQARAQAMNLTNVAFVPFQPASELPNLLAAADVSVVPCKRNTATVSVPSKMYNIMASARPMVAMAEPGTGTRGIIERAGCGICIDPEDTGQLVNALRRLYEDRELCTRLGTQGREYVVRESSFSAVVDRYERLFLELLEGQY